MGNPCRKTGPQLGCIGLSYQNHVVMGTRAPERLKGRPAGEPVTEGVGGSDHNPFHLRDKYLKATPMMAGLSQGNMSVHPRQHTCISPLCSPMFGEVKMTHLDSKLESLAAPLLPPLGWLRATPNSAANHLPSHVLLQSWSPVTSQHKPKTYRASLILGLLCSPCHMSRRAAFLPPHKAPSMSLSCLLSPGPGLVGA